MSINYASVIESTDKMNTPLTKRFCIYSAVLTSLFGQKYYAKTNNSHKKKILGVYFRHRGHLII